MTTKSKKSKQSAPNYANASGMTAWLMKKFGRSDKKNGKTSRRSRVASYIPFYMMLASIFSACDKLPGQNTGKNADKNKKEGSKPRDNQLVDSIDFARAKADMGNIDTLKKNPGASKKVDLGLDKSVRDMVALYWPEVALGITEMETSFTKATVISGEERSTSGPGLTWIYVYDKNGVLHQYENNAENRKKYNITRTDPDFYYEQMRRHLEFETMQRMREALKGKNNITRRHVIGVAYAGYQRPADMKKILAKIEKAKTLQETADAFRAPPNLKTKRGKDVWAGTTKRRWWCAAIACGVITPEDFVNMPVDAFSKVDIKTVYVGSRENGHFKLDTATVKSVLARAMSRGGTTCEEYLSKFDTGRKILSGIKKDDKRLIADNSLEKVTATQQPAAAITADAEYKAAIADFRAGKYSSAAKKFEKLTDKYPNDALLCNDLAATYNKLARYDDAIKMSRKVLKEIGDKSQYAAAQYNAAVAYEKKGDLERALANYKLAVKNGSASVKKDVKRIEDKIAENTKKQNKKNKKKVAFNAGQNKLKQRGYAANLAMYKKLNKVQDA